MRIIGLLHALVLLLALAPPLRAQNYEVLKRDFDSRALTLADKRFLQTALAFEGDYIGLLDGAWGRLSQNAMERFSRRKFGRSSEDWDMAVLAYSFINSWHENGWEIEYFPSLGMSFLIPKKTTVIEPPSKNFTNIRHSQSSLAISTGIHSIETVNRIHEYTIDQGSRSKEPYLVRKDGLAITRVSKSDGSLLYTRSDFVEGAWSTILISASYRDANILGAVSSSIQKGYAAPIVFTSGGYLENIVHKTNDLMAELEKGDVVGDNEKTAARPSEVNEGSQGSGFFVSEKGHVLTNAHVIENCSRFEVDGKSASLVGRSKSFDLAILQSEMPSGKTFAYFSPSPPQLNSDVTAIGFPYSGLLGGLNVTRGAVSALQGIAGDETTIQISAPVQSGNSGGPLLGADGEVVGVVVSKLNAKVISEVLGDTPQNVNFAIRGEIAKLFLSQNGIDPANGVYDAPLDGVTLAKQAQAFTVQITCR